MVGVKQALCVLGCVDFVLRLAGWIRLGRCGVAGSSLLCWLKAGLYWPAFGFLAVSCVGVLRVCG